MERERERERERFDGEEEEDGSKSMFALSEREVYNCRWWKREGEKERETERETERERRERLPLSRLAYDAVALAVRLCCCGGIEF